MDRLLGQVDTELSELNHKRHKAIRKFKQDGHPDDYDEYKYIMGQIEKLELVIKILKS